MRFYTGQQSFLDLLEEAHRSAQGDSPSGSSPHGPRSVEDLPFSEVDLFPHFEEIEHGELFTLSLRNKTSEYTHGLHRFPAKFIPQIPRWALREFASAGSWVLDPFMGSGTTLVEGLLHEGTTIGVDIDPLARLISHAKTDMPTSARITALAGEIDERWGSTASTLTPPMADIVNFLHWFSADAWGKLQSLMETITGLTCTDVERRFLLVVFSSVLRWVSNADDQSQKTYVSGTLRKNPPEVRETFWRFLARALHGLRDLELARIPDAKVEIRDADNALALSVPAGTIDLIVTSPPYLDSVDYMYNLMLEYFWLGPLLGVPDRKTYNVLRRAGVGAKIPGQHSDVAAAMLTDLIEKSEISPERLRSANAYFDAMLRHFQEAARSLRPGGRYVLVVGNSQTKTGIIPVHDCLIRLAANSGLGLEKAFAYRIRRHYMKFPRKGRGGIILIDWIIVLRKTEGHVEQPERLPLTWATLGHNKVAN
jgi:DNA modification methylase